MKQNKFQFSKIWPIVTTLIFIGVLVYCALNANYENDTVLTVMVTACGSVELTTIVFYMKNSWMEKVSRQKIEVVKTTSQERLNYNKEMMLFMKENGLTRDTLDAVEADSPMDELDNNAIDNLNASVDSDLEEASSSPEIQSL